MQGTEGVSHHAETQALLSSGRNDAHGAAGQGGEPGPQSWA